MTHNDRRKDYRYELQRSHCRLSEILNVKEECITPENISLKKNTEEQPKVPKLD